MRRPGQLSLRGGGPVAAAALAFLLCSAPSHAGLFDDDEARRAILDIRQRIDSLNEELRRTKEDNAQLRRSLLTLQNQIEANRNDQATIRGQNEQLVRDVADLQRRQKELAQGVDERMRKLEPEKLTLDGMEFSADPTEKKDFDAALATFRQGNFPAAQGAFIDFVKRYPGSGFTPSALFWLGNAQYANRNYKEAIVNFRALLAQNPNHARAPEAMLALANCQIELKAIPNARKTLEDLVKNYPQSEAAGAAKQRLTQL
ncbi:MAG: tol-pal system protein YbgF [Xylophilus ampelinus]